MLSALTHRSATVGTLLTASTLWSESFRARPRSLAGGGGCGSGVFWLAVAPDRLRFARSHMSAVIFGSSIFLGPRTTLFQAPPDYYKGALQIISFHWAPAVFLTAPI